MLIQLITSYAPQYRDTLLDTAWAALDAGMPSIQFSWVSNDAQMFHFAERLKRITESTGSTLIVNNRIDVALAVEADVVHLGQGDAPVEVARRLLPAHTKIGLTVSTMSELRAAESQPVDYYGIGAVFASKTKAGAAIGTSALNELSRATRRPVVAIGGITAPRLESIALAGASGFAVIGAVYDFADKRHAVERLLDDWHRARERCEVRLQAA